MQSAEPRSISDKAPSDSISGSSSRELVPVSYAMAEPLNETELTALLLASPLYQKLEDMKRTLTGGVKLGHRPAPGESLFQDTLVHFYLKT